jgi:hypothetical protein
MATTKATARTTTKKRRPSINSVAGRFLHWRQLKDEKEATAGRQETARLSLLEYVQEHGEEDDKGNRWYDLSEPMSYTDHNGKVFVYVGLKAERHLTPSKPEPDPDLAEEWLRKHKRWLTSVQEKALNDLRLQLRYARITVEVDLDAFASLYWDKTIAEKDYDAMLEEQTETFQFKPIEST